MSTIVPQASRWQRRNVIVREVTSRRSLPMLPDLVRNLNALLKDPDVDAVQVSALIESEPVAAGRVVSLANSAFYGAGRVAIHDVQMAVQRLGFDAVRRLVYSAVLPDLFAGVPSISHIQFWQHSFTVGLVARHLYTREEDPESEEADITYLAGLLHDIGILVFLILYPEEYTAFTRRHFKDGVGLAKLECEEFGIDHAEAGAMFIGRHWNLDERLVQAVNLHHHLPTAATMSKPVVRCVYAANVVCNLYNYTHGRIESASLDHIELLTSLVDLGYNQSTVENLLAVARENVSMMQSILTS